MIDHEARRVDQIKEHAEELLEALEDLLFGAERGIKPHQNYIDKARAAIAKAKGAYEGKPE